HLRHLDDGRDFLTVTFDRNEIGLRGEIVIPNIVMDYLVVPGELSRLRVDRRQRVGVKVVAFAVAAETIVGRRRDRQKHEPSLLVHGHFRPDVHAGALFPRVSGPGVVSGLAGLRDGVEAPDELSRAGVERAYVPARSVRGALGDERAADEKVLKYDGWR